jgi:uncharacterized protein (TIGR03437 family)
VDSTNTPFLLRGVGVPAWDTAAPPFRIIQQRWNMNAVRLPVEVAVWRKEGQPYFDRLSKTVAAANAEGLVAILAAVGDDASGLPGTGVVDFWRACAAAFRTAPGVILSLYHEPQRRNNADWRTWHDAMQPLVNAIRAAGATQIVSASSYQDVLGFQGFQPDFYVTDPNVMYEVHPYFDTASTDDQRTANFGNLAGIFPMFAGAWGIPTGKPIPACTGVPNDVNRATEMLFQAVAYFDARGISWSVADFAPGSLIGAGADYPPTALDKPWTCDGASGPGIGIGQFVLLWITGGPAGFGSLQASQISSAAGGFPGPIAPGEIITIFGQLIGPAKTVAGSYDAAGRLPVALSETQVFFDGVAAPLFAADAFQVNVQVPWETAGRKSTMVQLIYRGVPSNVVELPLVDTAPGIFAVLGTTQAAVLNQDGIINDAGSPAPRGSVVSFFATGLGQSTPPSATGVRAAAAGGMANTATFKMANVPVEVLYAGPAPGLVGVTQINARIPLTVPISGPADRVSITVSAGGAESRQGVTFWVK